MKKKGFTLIELLAVILILGIIALIAIPTVNTILHESRKGAFQSSVENILKAGEQKYFTEEIKGNNPKKLYNLEDNELDYKGDSSIVGYVGVKGDNGAIAVHMENIVEKRI